MTPLTATGAFILFAAASFFFALAESALFSLGKWQVRQLAERLPGGVSVEKLLSQPQELLSTIVMGNTFAYAAMLATALWMAMHQDWPMLWTAAGLLPLALLGTEVAPKALAVRAPEFWAVRVAPVMVLLQAVSRPFRRVALRCNEFLLRRLTPKSLKPPPGISDEEYQELIELAFQHGTLAKSEKEIILQILGLDRRTARDVMKPRSQMACISDDSTVEEMIAAARKCHYKRLPMFDETPDTIVGILNTRALLLDPEVDLSEVIEFPSFVPESMNLLQLLISLQRQKRGLAVVLDEFGGTAGIVTMQAILAEVVGDIRDESETQGFVMEKLGEGRWRVSGTMRVDDFRREYPPLGEINDVDTMGGLLAREMDIIPAQGDSAVFRGVKLTALAADERRVKELLVEVKRR